MSDAPFTFRSAQPAGSTPEQKPKRKRRAAQVVTVTEAQMGATPRRRRSRKAPDDHTILKACVKKLRQAGDAAGIVATLRIMFE